MGRLRGIAMVAVLVSVAVSGCFDPFRVRVAPETLEASPLDWNVTVGDVNGRLFGQKSMETRYFHSGAGGPPYWGVLQVFSIRGGDLREGSKLLDFMRTVVEDGLGREGVSIDSTRDREGERTLRNGETTVWFSHEGYIRRASDDSIFLPGGQEGIVVRVLGEGGYDGRSKTSFVVVAFVQVGTRTSSSVPGVIPDSETRNEQTWFEIVSDPAGSVGGASLPPGRGLIFNLRTHA